MFRFALVPVLIWILLILSYVANAVKLAFMFIHNEPLTTMFIGRIIGVFAAPLGVILGWF